MNSWLKLNLTKVIIYLNLDLFWPQYTIFANI